MSFGHPKKLAYPLIGSAPSLVPIGDSITGIGQGAIGPVPYFGDNGFWATANMLAGHPFEITGIYYYPGEGMSVIVPAFQNVLALRPTATTIMAGTNDLSSGAAFITAGLTTMFEQAQSAGIYVFACGILPRPSDDESTRAIVLQVNRWCQDYWRVNTGGEYVDLFSSVVDPTSLGQAWIAGTTRDNIHPSGSGAMLMGKVLAPRFAALGKAIELVSSPEDDFNVNPGSNQFVRNPLMIGTGGTATSPVTGSIATGWTCYVLGGSPTVVGSLVARADGYGYDQQLAITATTSSDSVRIYNNARSDNVGWPQGKMFTTEASVSVVGTPVNLKQFCLYGPTGGDMEAFVSATGLPYLSGWTGIYRVPPQPWIDPSSADWMAQFQIDFAGPGNATVKMGRVGTYAWTQETIG